jgi:hypothetical protein
MLGTLLPEVPEFYQELFDDMLVAEGEIYQVVCLP